MPDAAVIAEGCPSFPVPPNTASWSVRASRSVISLRTKSSADGVDWSSMRREMSTSTPDVCGVPFTWPSVGSLPVIAVASATQYPVAPAVIFGMAMLPVNPVMKLTPRGPRIDFVRSTSMYCEPSSTVPTVADEVPLTVRARLARTACGMTNCPPRLEPSP